MRIEFTNFISTTLRFSEKFDHTICLFLYLVICLLRVTVSLLCRSQARIISSPVTNNVDILTNWNLYHTSGTYNRHMATKQWLSGNILPNIKTYKNGSSNFSENLGVVGLKFFDSLNSHHKIYQFTLILYGVSVRCDRGRFSVHSPFIEKSLSISLQRVNDRTHSIAKLIIA